MGVVSFAVIAPISRNFWEFAREHPLEYVVAIMLPHIRDEQSYRQKRNAPAPVPVPACGLYRPARTSWSHEQAVPWVHKQQACPKISIACLYTHTARSAQAIGFASENEGCVALRSCNKDV